MRCAQYIYSPMNFDIGLTSIGLSSMAKVKLKIAWVPRLIFVPDCGHMLVLPHYVCGRPVQQGTNIMLRLVEV